MKFYLFFHTFFLGVKSKSYKFVTDVKKMMENKNLSSSARFQTREQTTTETEKTRDVTFLLKFNCSYLKKNSSSHRSRDTVTMATTTHKYTVKNKRFVSSDILRSCQ